MSIRLAILATIDEGIVSSDEIIVKLEIKRRSFHNSIRFMINQGWLISSTETARNRFSCYAITSLGREKLDMKMTDNSPEGQRRPLPDYNRMREYLQVECDLSKSELITLWNDNTDFYLPYEGESEFRRLGNGAG